MLFFNFCYLGICLDSLAHNLQFKFLSASRRNPLPWPEAGSVHALYEMDSVIRDLMAKGNPNPRIAILLYFTLSYFIFTHVVVTLTLVPHPPVLVTPPHTDPRVPRHRRPPRSASFMKNEGQFLNTRSPFEL